MGYSSRIPRIAASLPDVAYGALSVGAHQVADTAAIRAPVRRGRLKKAVHVDPTRDGYYVVAGDDAAWYGHIVEFGSVKSAPRPFLAPALEDHREAITSMVADAIKQVVE